jgi:hypothetical protein
MGPMSGRGAGYCSGSGAPGYATPGPGRGYGMGGGRGRAMGGGGGRGRRNMFYATGQPGWMGFGPYPAPFQNPDPAIEKQALKNQAEALQSQLNMIKQRLDEMDGGTPPK